jgi:hypothetical protein
LAIAYLSHDRAIASKLYQNKIYSIPTRTMSNLTNYQSQAITSQDLLGEELLTKIIQSGDLSYLSESDRLIYYFAYCRQLGLNPLSRPFDYIQDKGKITLYPNAIAASQLRDKRNVSTRIIKEECLLNGEIYSVLVEARIGDRIEQATGKVSLAGLDGRSKATAMKKAETQARRRATLAIVGLDAIGDEDRKAQVSDMPDDIWQPDLESKLMTIASTPLPDWDKFWAAFCGCCDRCQSTDQLEKLIRWTFAQKAYLAYPQNQIDVENRIAEVQARFDF